MKLFIIASAVIVGIFITLCILIHNHPTANPAPLYYFALPFMIAKLTTCYLILDIKNKYKNFKA